MSIITRLTALLTADSAQFEQGVKKARRSLVDFQGFAISAAKMIGTAIGAIGGAFAALGIKQAGAIDKTAKLAASLGVSLKEFQAMSLVADEAGVSQDALAVAFTKTQKALIDAAEGSKQSASAFAQLGLNTKELLQLTPDQQFSKIAEALSQIENPTQRTALALDIFGKSGRDIINMLGDYSGKIQEAREFTNRFGLALNELDAAKVEEANDAWSRVLSVLEGAGNVIAVKVSPLVTALSNQFISAMPTAYSFGQAISDGMLVAGTAIDLLRAGIQGLEIFIKGVISGFAQLMAKFEEGVNALKNNEFVKKGANAIGLEIQPPSDDLQKWAERTKKSVRESVSELKNMKNTADAIYEAQRQAENRAKSAQAAKPVSNIDFDPDTIKQTQSETKKLGDTVKDTTDLWDDFGKSSGNAIDTLISDLGRGNNALQSFRNFAVSILQDVIKSLNGGQSIGSTIGGLLSQSLSSRSATSFISSTYGVGGSLGSTLGGLLSASTKGSFATGIGYVPYDMDARLHRGEMVVPRQQAESISSGSGTTINIDARGASQGVEEKIRQVMNEVNALRLDTPKIALNVVSDQSRRNPNFVR